MTKMSDADAWDWIDKIRLTFWYILHLSAAIALVFVIVWISTMSEGPAKLDCSLASFHPDVSTINKERCRGLR